MAYTLPEALWLGRRDVSDDVLVGYPTVDRAALRRAGRRRARPRPGHADGRLIAQLDIVDAVTPPGGRPAVRLCLDLDASWRARAGCTSASAAPRCTRPRRPPPWPVAWSTGRVPRWSG